MSDARGQRLLNALLDSAVHDAVMLNLLRAMAYLHSRAGEDRDSGRVRREMVVLPGSSVD